MPATITADTITLECDILASSAVVPTSRTILHRTIGGTIDRTERPPAPRSGPLDVLVDTYPAALDLAGLLTAATVKTLAWDGLPYWNMRFTLEDGVQPQVSTHETGRWQVSCEVVEV